MEARRVVGWNLRRIRVDQHLSIEELAGRAEVDASFVARIERGTANPSIDVIERLAKALKVRLTALVEESALGTRPPRPLRAGRRPA